MEANKRVQQMYAHMYIHSYGNHSGKCYEIKADVLQKPF